MAAVAQPVPTESIRICPVNFSADYTPTLGESMGAICSQLEEQLERPVQIFNNVFQQTSTICSGPGYNSSIVVDRSLRMKHYKINQIG